ncbi:MAG: Gfo/Idh/MocA family oxidoreductase [Gammaproteobacteria bacterium]|nr:MAG: Gfo/Idh/MocA family oxidoreductase [Gammaproteobacteria bacterium]
MSSIRLGMIGAGQIALFTSREFRRHPGCDVIAVADPNAERAAELAGVVRAEHTYTEVEELLAHDDLDAVYIAVPNAFHEEVAIKALAAGKHVLLDKPFALDAQAARNIIDAAEKADRTLMLGMNQRFERNVQSAKALIAEGRLGDVYHLKAFWRRRAGIPRMGSWFTNKSVAGGGALLDIGVHVLDVALHLIDNFRPTSVSGATFTRFGNRGLGEGGWGRSEREFDDFDVDDFATALIRLEGGAVITLEASWALHQPSSNDHDVVAYGEDAGLAVYGNQLFEPGDGNEYRIVQNPTTPAIAYPHCSRAEHFINVLLGDETPVIDLNQSLAVQKILDGIYESAATGKEIQL